MKHDSDKHHRRSIRLKGYDYSQAGAYFMTICTQDRECLFGDIVGVEMRLNDAGHMVQKWWHESAEKFKHIELDEFVIMPNHVHGIIVIVGAQFIAPFDSDATKRNKQQIKQGVMNHAPTAVGESVRVFKARCTHTVNQIRNTQGHPLWQRNYYEHIIRSEEEMNRIRKYIVENPMKWVEDKDNPANFTRRGMACHAPTQAIIRENPRI